jgi:hypothetical protein
MVGGAIHREVIHGEISRVLVLHPALATTRCASAARAELRLDNAFVLIEGHPEAAEQVPCPWKRKWKAERWSEDFVTRTVN